MPELIDRRKLLNNLCKKCGHCKRMEDIVEDIVEGSANPCNVHRIISDQPTIEPEARHGRWIYVCEETMHDGWTYRKYKCSECGFQTVETINFCQNCGRDMRETDTNVGGKGGADNADN